VLAGLAEDVALPPGVPGGMPEYRQSLAASFFFKFYAQVFFVRPDSSAQ
jgi:xanthine dehydrogenase/oxidase